MPKLQPAFKAALIKYLASFLKLFGNVLLLGFVALTVYEISLLRQEGANHESRLQVLEYQPIATVEPTASPSATLAPVKTILRKPVVTVVPSK